MPDKPPPKPDLTDPNFEPTDEQLHEIVVEMMVGVRARAEEAKARMDSLMSEAISEIKTRQS
jgi:hypothetical protein